MIATARRGAKGTHGKKEAMRNKKPLFTYLKKSKHLEGCKMDKKARTCSCGFYAAVDDYLRLLEIQAKFYRNLAEKIVASEK